MNGAPLLDIRNLTVEFGGLRALDGVDIQVNEGEIVSVIGPNGAGKTTLFNAITASVEADGEILFEGKTLLGLDPNQVTARGVARTFQNVRLFANMTVLENVMVSQHCRTKQGTFGALFYTKAFRQEEAEIRARAEQILGFFGSRLVGFRLDQPAAVLSYANRRRLEIARAMATQPKLLLLDEPVAGMNPVESAELTGLIGRLREEWGFTIVVIEHDMEVVREVSDRRSVPGHHVMIAERD
ncbi:MAG: ABC transporter ATP-binding protein [bacterium]|nr:ABC transporter ATP-binding protein [bacterium]